MPIIRYKGKNYAGSADDVSGSNINYESGDELDPSEPAEVPKLNNKETLKSFAQKVSIAVRNIRYLLKMLGSTDISTIGDGTTTGAINALKINKVDKSGGTMSGNLTIAGRLLTYNGVETSGGIRFSRGTGGSFYDIDDVRHMWIGVDSDKIRMGLYDNDINDYFVWKDESGTHVKINVDTVGGDGKYVKSIKQENGKIVAESDDFTPENIGALPLTGGKLTGRLQEIKGSFVNRVNGTVEPGFVVFMEIKIKVAYADWPILFTLSERNAGYIFVYLEFSNTSSVDPSLNIFEKFGYDRPIYIKKTATSTWQICIQKTQAYSNVEVISINNLYDDSGLEVTMKNVQINTADFVASEWTQATIGGKIKEAEHLNYFRSTASDPILADEITNGIGYVSNATGFLGQAEGAIYKQTKDVNWIHRIYGDYRTGQIALQGKNNGNWENVRKVVDHLNYDTLIPAATTSKAGLMSPAQVTALDNKAPAIDSPHYVRVFNSAQVEASATVTVNDLAKDDFSMGLVQGGEDNPSGGAHWIHAISMAWSDNNNSQWISQIAINSYAGAGLYYRTNGSGTIVGRAWYKVVDNGNFRSIIPEAATNASGLMSAADKTKLEYKTSKNNLFITNGATQVAYNLPYCTLSKINNVAMISLEFGFNPAPSTASAINIGTLPENARPLHDFEAPILNFTTRNVIGTVSISTAGVMNFYHDKNIAIQSSYTYRLDTTYITNTNTV